MIISKFSLKVLGLEVVNLGKDAILVDYKLSRCFIKAKREQHSDNASFLIKTDFFGIRKYIPLYFAVVVNNLGSLTLYVNSVRFTRWDYVGGKKI